jgi:5'-nucleotidase
VVEDIEQPDYSHLPPEVPTDVRAIGENFITITPLQYNLTDVQGFQHLHRNSWLD